MMEESFKIWLYNVKGLIFTDSNSNFPILI